ncbi:hypothetical protein SAMN04488688_105160 [Paenibacillus sp. cl141a]|nr:hypothetical protein SAMN04488688_105160 [Paenibacillus sp. cl141a]
MADSVYFLFYDNGSLLVPLLKKTFLYPHSVHHWRDVHWNLLF